GTPGCGGSRSVDTALPAHAWRPPPARHARRAWTGTPPWIGARSVARTLAGSIDLVGTQRRSVAGERARSPFLCSDFLQDLDVHDPFGQHLLEPSVLRLQLP